MIYIGMKNDLSFLIANEINLYEHQSTLNENMPNKTEEPAVESVARFVNINYGHNKTLMDNCKRLHDYSYFVDCVRKIFRATS